MKKRTWLGVTLLLFVAIFVSAQMANARPQHKKEWDNKYLKPGLPMHKALNGASNCNICHQGKDRKNRNAYGKAISALIGKNEKDAAKVQTALDAVEAKHSDPDDDKSPTFGDLINGGKLPVTNDEP